MRTYRLVTILDLYEPVHDCKPYQPPRHKVFNGIRVKNVRSFRYERHA